MFATIVGAQVIAAVGYGARFPWSVPALLAGAAGPEQPTVGWFSNALVVVAAAATIGTVVWWERADQHGRHRERLAHADGAKGAVVVDRHDRYGLDEGRSGSAFCGAATTHGSGEA